MHPFDDRVVLREALRGGRPRDRRTDPARRSPRSVGGTVGGADAAPTVAGRPDRSSSTRAPVEPGGLFVAVVGEQVDGHDFVARGASPRGAAAVPRRASGRRCRTSWSTTRCRRSVGSPAARRSHSCWPALAVVGDHRVVGQDHHQGPARRGPASRSGRRSRRVGSLNTEVGVPLTVLGADADDPVPRRRDGRPRRRPHRLPVRASRRRGSASCSTSAPRTSASSARREAIAVAKSELVAGAARADGGSPCSTPTTRWCAAMADVDRGAGRARSGSRPDADVRAERRHARRRGPADRSRCVHAGPRPADGDAAAARRAPGRPTRWPPPRSALELGATARRRRRRAGHRRRRAAAGGWRSPSGRTA